MNFINGAELLAYCEKENKKISEAMFERETTYLEQNAEKTECVIPYYIIMVCRVCGFSG